MRARVMPLVVGLAVLGLSGCSLDAASLASLFGPAQSIRHQAPVSTADAPSVPVGALPTLDPSKTTVVVHKPNGTTTVTGSVPNAPAQPTTGRTPAPVQGPLLPPGAAPLTEGTPILTPMGQLGAEGQALLASLAEVEAELSAAMEALLAKAELAGALSPRPELVEGMPPAEPAAPAARRLSQADVGFGVGLGAGGLSVNGPDGATVQVGPSSAVVAAPNGTVAVSQGPNGGSAVVAGPAGSFVAPVRPGRVADVLRALAKRATLALDRGADGRLMPRLNVSVGAEELPDGRARSLSLGLDRSQGAKLVVNYEVAAKGDRPAINLVREVSVVNGALQHAVHGKLGDEVVRYLRSHGGGGEGQLSGALAMAFRFGLAGPQPNASVPNAAANQAAAGVKASAPPSTPDLLGDRPPFDPLPANAP